MNLRLLSLALACLFVASCSHGPPPEYYINNIVPAGSRIEYYAQIADGSWQRTMIQDPVPRAMHIKEAEKWAISAAQQRLGGKWKDYSIRVIPPDHPPIVSWQRQPLKPTSKHR